MPRPRKPARVFMREDDKSWVIRDGGKDKRTGHRGKSQVKEAEAALAEYLVERGRGGEVETEQGQLGYLLDAYAEARQGEVADPDRIDYAIEALAPFWSNKSLEEVTEDNCREYTKTRTSNPTARRELGTMRAALNLAFRQRKIPYAPPVWLPAKSPRRPEYLTRTEVAKVLWRLRRKKRTRHAARLFLARFYTGSRPRTVSNTTWEPRTDGPWLDLERRTWHRRGDDEKETVKARKPHRIPRKLYNHLRRWKRIFGGTYVVEHPRHPGKPCLTTRKALATACEAAGVRRVTDHAVKHTAITLFIQDGGTIAQAASYFSTSAATIEKVYWHHSPEFQQDQVDIIDNAGRRPGPHGNPHGNPRKSAQIDANECGGIP